MANAGMNDEKILLLKKQIEKKKEELKGGKKRFTPITNCTIEIDGVRYNLNASGKDQLQLLLVKLNMYRLSSIDLKLTDFSILGYKIDDWITDIKSKLDIITLTDKERDLHIMEQKLETLLSEDKKIELELGSIEELLK
jgi:hypothetical protein